MDNAELLMSEASLLYFSHGGSGDMEGGWRGGRGGKLNITRALGSAREGGGAIVLVVANSLTWNVTQIVSVPVVGLAREKKEEGAGGGSEGVSHENLCIVDGTSGKALEMEVGPLLAWGKEGGGMLIKFSVEVPALGFSTVVLATCGGGEREKERNDSDTGSGMGERRDTHTQQPILDQRQATGGCVGFGSAGKSVGGGGVGSTEEVGRAGEVSVSVQLWSQKSSGVNGYSSGASRV